MPIQAAQGGQDWHGYHPGAGRSRSNRCATNFPVGTAIALPAQRLSRRRERRLVADAAYHRRPYFTGAFRARATSQPLATLRAMLTLPILFHSAAGPLARQRQYHTPNRRGLQELSQTFPNKFSPPAPALLRRNIDSGAASIYTENTLWPDACGAGQTIRTKNC